MVLKPYTYPASDYDLPQRLLHAVGSFWSDTFDGNDLVASLLHSRAQLDAQAHLDLLELVASISRFTVPIFHKKNWFPLTLKASEMNLTPLNSLRYGDAGETYNEGTENVYGGQKRSVYFCWTLPTELKDFQLILNRITLASLTLTRGVDFFVEGNVIAFVKNPFESELVTKLEMFEGNTVVDREITLWIYCGQFDFETIYKQFGYVLSTRLASSEAYRDFLNAIFDGLVEGTTVRNVEAALSAICDVPLVREAEETVQHILTDSRSLWVVTDKHAYGFALGSTAVVSVGEVVKRGQRLTDTLTVYEFNRGEVPDPAEVRALSVGRGVLAAGYHQDIVFENKTVPLQVTTDGGYTRIEFEVQGLPGDVAKFWDDLHANGVAADQTLAMLLDKRTNKVGQPTAMNLPSTINPLEFLCQNVFRNNLYLVRVRTGLLGPNALGLHNGRLLRKLVPAHTTMILLTQLEVSGDEITMDGPGDEYRAGYEEDVKVFLGLTATDEMDPADYIDERVRAFQIQGRCE